MRRKGGEKKMVSLAIIADDLTGASDTGVQFAKQDLKTTVLFSESQLVPSNITGDVIVINSDSRAIESDEAYNRVRNIASTLHNSGVKNIFKKIDSTMRGNVGVEIDGVMDEASFDVALVVPAFPSSHRVTEQGFHYVNGLPLKESEFSNDPTCPVTDSHLQRLLEKQSKRKIGLITLEDVRKGSEHLSKKLKEFAETNPSSVIVLDAKTDDDLQIISKAGASIEQKALWVGSAGIAAHLSKDVEKVEPNQLETKKARHPILFVAGSMSSVTHNQIQALKEHNKLNEIIINPSKFFKEEEKDQEVKRVVQEGIRLLKEGDLIISTNRDPDMFDDVKALQRSMDLSNYELGQLIAKTMGEMTRILLKKKNIQGLVLTGGDIAGVTCNELDGKGIRVMGEVEAGIPYGELFGGPHDGLPLVTKAGAFGREHALIHALETLLGEKEHI